MIVFSPRHLLKGFVLHASTALRAVLFCCAFSILAAAAHARPVPGPEEHPFRTGHKIYREVYASKNNTPGERQAIRRYGTIPFDFPSAASCMADPAVAPENGLLDWARIRSLEALEVCTARVLNRFSDPAAAETWVIRQGFTLSFVLTGGASCRGDYRNFYWVPGGDPGPAQLWAAQSWLTRWGNRGVQLKVQTCRDQPSLRNLDIPGQKPPFHMVRVGWMGRFQK